MAVNLDTLSGLANEAEDLVKRIKNELAKVANTADTEAQDEAIKAAEDSADKTASTVTGEGDVSEPVGSDSSPEVKGEINDTTGQAPTADPSTPVQTQTSDDTQSETQQNADAPVNPDPSTDTADVQATTPEAS